MNSPEIETCGCWESRESHKAVFRDVRSSQFGLFHEELHSLMSFDREERDRNCKRYSGDGEDTSHNGFIKSHNVVTYLLECSVCVPSKIHIPQQLLSILTLTLHRSSSLHLRLASLARGAIARATGGATIGASIGSSTATSRRVIGAIVGCGTLA